MKARILAVVTAAILAGGSLSGCFGGSSDDCESLPAGGVVTHVLAKPGGGGGKGGGSKGKSGTKPKTKPHTGTGGHVDTDDDCDED